MQHSNNTINNFPANSDEYFTNKLDGLSNYQWLFDPTNPYYFCFWVSVLINKTHILSLMKGWSFFKLKNLPKLLPESITKSIATLSLTLNRLVAIGVLDMRVIKKNKQYKVNWAFLHSTNISIVNNLNLNPSLTITRTIFDENFVESPFDLISYENEFFPNSEECNNSNKSLSHQKDDLTISDPVILENQFIETTREEITVNVATSHNPEPLITLDPLEIEIKERFEAITGKTLNLKKNRKPLTELKEIATQAKDILILAFRNVANHIAEKGTKVYNLGYVVATANNLLNPKTNTPKVESNNKSEIQAHSSIGGDPAKHRGVAPTPEQQASQLEQDKKDTEIFFRNEALREQFFNSLPENDQQDLVSKKLQEIKNYNIYLWDKLTTLLPEGLTKFLIDKIKDDLLDSYLIHQDFLVGGSG